MKNRSLYPHLNQKKRPFSRALPALILLAVLVACQNPTPNVPSADPTPSPSRAAATQTSRPTLIPTATQVPPWWLPEEDLQGSKISILHPWSGDLAHQMETLVEQFNQENPWGISAAASGLGSAQQVFLQSEAGISVGSGPQVVIAQVEELAYWFKQGHILPLDEFVSDATYGMDEQTRDDFQPQFWQQDVIGQQRLGIPAARDAYFLIYNRTWARELGFNTPPATIMQLTNQACAAYQAVLNDDSWENNGTGGWIINRNEYVLLSWLRGFGVADFPEEESAYAFDQPESASAFRHFRKLFDDSCVWESRNPTPYEYFALRQALFYSANLDDLAPQTTTMQIFGNQDDWGVLPFITEDGRPVVITHGPSYGVFRSTKTQELASWLFIRWVSELPQARELAKRNPDFPVSQALLAELEASRGEKWASAAALLADAQPSPRTSEWRVARFVLPDAFRFVLELVTTPDQIPDILKMLDETIQSLASQPAVSNW